MWSFGSEGKKEGKLLVSFTLLQNAFFQLDNFLTHHQQNFLTKLIPFCDEENKSCGKNFKLKLGQGNVLINLEDI